MAGNLILAQATRSPVDQMDRGMDMLHTVWIALNAEDELDKGNIERIRCTLDTAIQELEPCRELLNRHGDRLPDFDAGKAVQP